MKTPKTPEQLLAKKLAQRAARYGLTVGQLYALEAITQCCWICGRLPKPGKSLYIDHDHKSGRVRGRLCFTCNYRLLGRGALGKADVHEAAARYLRGAFDARTL